MDFSPSSEEAGSVAKHLALKKHLPLEVVHVDQASKRELRRGIRRHLDIEVEGLREAGVDARVAVLSGHEPAGPLSQYIKKTLPELVIMGNQAKGPLDRWALPSLSEQIADASPVPVLLVQDSTAFSEWDWTESTLKVQLCLDFSAASDAVLRWARTLRQIGPCEFFVGHVIQPVYQKGPSGEQRTGKPAREALERDLRKKVRDVLGDESLFVIVRQSNDGVGGQLDEIARERKADLLAVGTHQWQGIQKLLHGSVSFDLQHLTECNVVVIPLQTKFDPGAAHIPDFHRVLVATDFSELGNSAIPFACGACGIGGLVRIVHVVKGQNGLRPGKIAELKTRLRGLVPLETAARCQPPEIEIVRADDASKAICAEAAKFGADLVCLASHGTGASRAIHGSVTKAVLKQLPRPLLVIRQPSS
jgi:nucleotide-binding universal stress UspA family protein